MKDILIGLVIILIAFLVVDFIYSEKTIVKKCIMEVEMNHINAELLRKT